jgi:alpha-glucosidase
LQDPMYHRSGGTDPGRDGCRVPLPWSGVGPPFGFSPSIAHVEPWLPQPARWAALTVEAQRSDPASMLSLYRAALRIRRSEPGLSGGAMTWLPSASDVLSFRRGDRFVSMTNMSANGIELPREAELLLASAEVDDGVLPPDATAWLRMPPTPSRAQPPSSTAPGGG